MGTILGDEAVTRVTALADAYEALVAAGSIPFAVEFRLPMRDLDKEWYAAHSRWQYPEHPPAYDWNLETGGDSDLGEVLVAPWSGVVLSASDWGGGVGKVVQVLGIKPGGELIVWAGWHMEDVFVIGGQIVSAGDEVGTIGNADGRYSAHLHEQICVVGGIGIPSPFVYVNDKRYDWRDCGEFYIGNGVDRGLVERCVRYGDRVHLDNTHA